MTLKELQKILTSIAPADREAMDRAKKRQAELAKPPGSLGKLEDMSIRLAGITGQVRNQLESCRILVFAADNGVIAEGVSSSPESVTMSQAVNMTRHITGMSALARYFGNSVVVADVGINAEVRCPAILNRKIRRSTRNLAKEPALTRQEVLDAMGVGLELAGQAKEEGVQAIGVGEMGIGNTTTSSAVASVLLGRPVQEMTGRGAGLSDEGLRRKIDAIRRGIVVNRPDAADPLGVLAALGGFDIAGLCGVFLGGALENVPILMDGFISGVAALCAVRLCPAAAKAVFASHVSSEPAARLVLEELDKKPFITANLHLGEGTGAVASLPLWDMALAVYNGCYSFAEGGITPYTPQC